METNSSFAKIVYLLAFIATIIGFSAFSQTTNESKDLPKQQPGKDNNKNGSNEDFKNDRNLHLDQLDLQLKQLDRQMDQLKVEIKNIDFSKAQKQIDEAMKKLDAQKISLQVNESLKKIDWTDINRQIDESVAKLDKVKMKEVKSEIEKAKAELEAKRSNMEFKIPKIEVEKMKAETKAAFENARKSIDKAKEEIVNMKEFSKALQKHGLIDQSKHTRIEVKNGELFIDGKKQSKEINEKYKKYYRKDNFNFEFQTDETF